MASPLESELVRIASYFSEQLLVPLKWRGAENLVRENVYKNVSKLEYYQDAQLVGCLVPAVIPKAISPKSRSKTIQTEDEVKDKLLSCISSGFLYAHQLDKFVPRIFQMHATMVSNPNARSVVLHIDAQEAYDHAHIDPILALHGLERLRFILSGQNEASDYVGLASVLALQSPTPILVVHIYQTKSTPLSWSDSELKLLVSESLDNNIETLFSKLNLIRNTKYQPIEFLETTSRIISVQLPGTPVNPEVTTAIVKAYQPVDLQPVVALASSTNSQIHVQGLNLDAVAQTFSPLYHGLMEIIHQTQSSIELQLITPTPNVVKNITSQTITSVDVNAIPYVRALKQLVKDRLFLANQIGTEVITCQSPEFGYGRILAHIHARLQLIDTITKLVLREDVHSTLRHVLSNYLLHKNDDAGNAKWTEAIYKLSNELPETIQTQIHLLRKPSYWLIGSDPWWYDLANSGFHQVLAAAEDVNVLILDTATPHPKKDLGLYAMTYGNAYVASTAIYASYFQAAQSLLEADRFPGPSVVLGYLPLADHQDLYQVYTIQQSKLAVDSGSWPLYRWIPNNSIKLSLDSTAINKELAALYHRESQITALAQPHPRLNIIPTLNQQVEDQRKRQTEESVQRLLAGLKDYGPLTLLFGSDGGNASKLAHNLGKKANQIGFQATVAPANDSDPESLSGLVVLIISTAGQGEFPVNAKLFWKKLSKQVTPLPSLRFGVFGLGDSHYWPDNKKFFNKPAHDIYNKLISLSAAPIQELGLGDDQDPDGFQTQYQIWEPQLWPSLGVTETITIQEPAALTDDQMKVNSSFLRGTIAEGLLDTSTGALCEADTKLTKFHGIYQQDDRDLREQRVSVGLEPAYSFMVRVRVPGGFANPTQWLAMDQLADQYGNSGLKLTTRQAFQFHGILKGHLRPTLQGINKVLMDTLAACGDVNRNVMVSCSNSPLHQQVTQFARDLSKHLSPQTSAYHEIWLADQMVVGPAVQDVEPMYGPTYLPRKFKIAIAIPPSNDVDVFAHCLGFITVADPEDPLKVLGFNVTVGGGMGMTHNNTKTFPRLGDLLGFCTPNQAIQVAESVLTVQRDFGDRTNRKHARLKYTIQDRGINWFRDEVESRLPFKLQPVLPYTFTGNGDRYGWYETATGWDCGLHVMNGRIRDDSNQQWKSGLSKIAHQMRNWPEAHFTLTANQNLRLCNLPPDAKNIIDSLLKSNHIPIGEDESGLRRNTMACVSLPTCGLAMAEAERYLPHLVDKLEHIIDQVGLQPDAITLRMTGCPNGCARPYVAEIGLVGKAPGTYNLYLGGGFDGSRLSKLYRANVDEPQILQLLTPLFQAYAQQRLMAERFGDFVIRTGVVNATLNGSQFHDN